MPPTLSSRCIRSFGHLQVTRLPDVLRIASAIQAPASNESNPGPRGRQGRAEHDRAQERPIGDVAPRAAEAPAPVGLVRGGYQRPLGRPGLGQLDRRRVRRTGNLLGTHGSIDRDRGERRQQVVSAQHAEGWWRASPWKARYASGEQTEGPDREPRRDRRADHPHVPRARHPVGRRVLRRRPRRAARRDGRRGLPDRPGAGLRVLPLDRRDPRGRPASRGRRSSIPATGSWPSARSSRRRSARRASRSSARRPRRSRRWATRRRPAGWPTPAGMPIVPGTREPVDIDDGEEAGAAHRLPAAGEGGLRRRRQGHARRARRASTSRRR